MATKQHSYKNYEVTCKVSILGVDVSRDLKSIEGIESSLDYPQLNEFRINEATFVLQDPNNNYNPQKPDNFYKATIPTTMPAPNPPISESGYRAPVKIEAGFIVNATEHLDTVYEGIILNITKDAKTGDVRIVCSDRSQNIRDDDVTDFGISKKMIVQNSGGNLHGNYPFFIGLTEPSLESVEGAGLERKQSLRTEGALDENNFQELPTGIQTEGGPLSRDPTLTFKSPYRSRTVESVIKKLLEEYDIQESATDIKLPIAISTGGSFFSNLGRPGYETSYPDEPSPIDFGQWQWPGTVTDMIADESNNKLYLLVSQTGSSITEPRTTNPKPRIIEWNLQDDSRSVLTVIQKDTNQFTLEECWRFVANSDFSIFYVLGTEPEYIRATRSRDSNVTTRPGFEFGSYDSSEYNNTVESKILIHKMTRSGTGTRTDPYAWARTTYIDPENSGLNVGTRLVPDLLLPQLAMHYHFGFGRTDSASQNRFPNRQGNIPDSRRNFHLASNGDLYYAYANRTQFGVAKATAANSVSKSITANRDDDGFNMAGFDFWIDEDNDHVYLAYTNIDIDRSSNPPAQQRPI